MFSSRMDPALVTEDILEDMPADGVICVMRSPLSTACHTLASRTSEQCGLATLWRRATRGHMVPMTVPSSAPSPGDGLSLNLAAHVLGKDSWDRSQLGSCL